MSVNKWASGLAVTLATSGSIAWAAGPVTFTYQGQLLDLNGQPSTDTVDLQFQILSPDGSCLLYEELHTGQNFTTSSGQFSVQVGSPLTSAKRTANDPALSMNQIFSNPSGALRPSGAANCAGGYTPTSGDSRRLRVTVIGPSGSDVLTPDQTISAAPFAVSAETLQGKFPGDFLFNSLSGMQAAIEALVSGTSSMYVKTDGSNLLSPVNFNNQRLVGIALPSAGTDAVNKNYADQRLAGIQIMNGTPANGQTLVFNSVSGQWQAGSPQDTSVHAHARANAAVCSGNQASQWNGTSWACVNSGASGSGSVTQVTTSQTVSLTSSSAKLIGVNFPNGGSIVLPDATTMPTGGPLFTIMNQNPEMDQIIPVLNSAGNFLGGIAANLSSSVFLFNNSTVAGSWALDSGAPTQSFGVEMSSVDSSGPAAWPQAFVPMGPNAFLISYTTYSGSSASYYVRVATYSTTAKTVTWGTPSLLGTSNSGSSVYFTPLSTTSAVAFTYGGSGYNAQVVTISGSSVSSVGTAVSVESYCQNSRTLDSGRFLCFEQNGGSNPNFSVYSVSGSSITLVTSGSVMAPTGEYYYGPLNPILLGGKVVVTACHVANSSTSMYSNAALVFDPADVSSQSVVELTTPVPGGGCGGYGYQAAYISSPFLPLDANNAWFMSTSNGVPTALKLTFTDALAVSATGASIPGGGLQFYNANGTYWLADTWSNQRIPITDISTLSVASPVRSFSCYNGIRYSPNRCVALDTPSSQTRMRLKFLVGY